MQAAIAQTPTPAFVDPYYELKWVLPLHPLQGDRVLIQFQLTNWRDLSPIYRCYGSFVHYALTRVEPADDPNPLLSGYFTEGQWPWFDDYPTFYMTAQRVGKERWQLAVQYEVCPDYPAPPVMSTLTVPVDVEVFPGEHTPHAVDVSTFRHFRFERRPQLGFCPPLESLFVSLISRDATGNYWLAGSTLEPGDPERDACLSGQLGYDGPCAVVRGRAARQLNADEAQLLDTAFSAVTIFDEGDTGCLGGPWETCIVTKVTWDNTVVWDHPCYAPRFSSGLRTIEGALEMFLKRSQSIEPTVCDGDCNHDGLVTVDELLYAAPIAANLKELGNCPAADRDGDLTVTVDELMAALHDSIAGCGGLTGATAVLTPR